MSWFRRTLWLALTALLAVGAATPASANLGVGEATAGQSGSALWEINRDASGTLYISDYMLPAILVVNPTTGAYTRYTFSLTASFVIAPGDAKPDSSGHLWWSDYYSSFGRLNPNTLQVTYWEVLSSLNLAPGGFAFDGSGRLWFTQYNRPQLLRFNPSNNELCRFTVNGGGNYLIAYGGRLWIGDSQGRRILRFDPATNQLFWWNLGGSASPQGLAFDADGMLWWADAQVPARIGRLNPNTNQATYYTGLPSNAHPVAVVPGVEVVWYTDDYGSAGFVDPARASGTTATLSTGASTVSPTCSTVSSATQTVTKSTGTFSFPPATWTLLSGTPAGLTVYIPPGTTPAPYGLAVSADRVWFSDQYRLTLTRTPRLPQAPVVSISLSGGNLTLSWPPVTQDEGGSPVTVSSYQVWRSGNPYFRPWDSGVTFVGSATGTSLGVGAAPSGGQSAFFAARSVASSGLISRTSNRVGAFSFTLVPGAP
ncbi:MAG: hypothetical protein RMN53_14430 [Anaerolineae bacterium]|nr:hypothetical protein [Anaerolineae bacterium]